MNTPKFEYQDLTSYLLEVSGWVDEALPAYLPEGEPAATLYDLARDYPSRGGKKFRPALLLLSTALVGGEPSRALPSAIALELFQNFALVHDDIEDDSHFRRGAPALHRKHGIPLALNAGDLLFNLVWETLLINRELMDSDTVLEVQRRFAEVFRRTFEGQAMDIGWCHSDHFPGRAEYQRMIQHKTGWYSGRGPCEIGALIGGGEAEVLSALGDFGEKLGIGFQIRDDLLNLTTDSAESAPGIQSGGYGKERGGDIAEGKRTMIVIEMLERVPTADQDRLKAVLLMPPQVTLEKDVEWVIELAHSCGAIETVEAHCREMAVTALGALDRLPESPQRSLLQEMTQYLVRERET